MGDDLTADASQGAHPFLVGDHGLPREELQAPEVPQAIAQLLRSGLKREVIEPHKIDQNADPFMTVISSLGSRYLATCSGFPFRLV